MTRFSQQICIGLIGLSFTASLEFAKAADCSLDPGREASAGEEVRLAVFDGEAVDIELPDAGEPRSFVGVHYEGSPDLKPLVITHGPGQTLASPFMTELALSLSELGYPVLALQMPLLERACEGPDAYPDTFPGSFERINAAASWLDKTYSHKPALVGHWVANAYFEHEPDAPFDTWIMNGITGSLSSTGENHPRILDVFGSEGNAMTLRWAWLRRFWLWLDPGSRQVEIAGADHEFSKHMPELAAEVDRFLRETE